MRDSVKTNVTNIEKMISNEEVDVVVATSAFGMGMHHPFLKWVLLWQAPTSLLALTQTIGRIARSSARGHAVLFWDYDDFRTLEWTLKNSIRKKKT